MNIDSITVNADKLDPFVDSLGRDRMDTLLGRVERRHDIDLELCDQDEEEIDHSNQAFESEAKRMYLDATLNTLCEQGILFVNGVGEDGRLRYTLHQDLAA